MSDPQSPEKLSTILDLYKAYLEDLGRIGARHETTRRFYLSVMSALFVFLSMAGEKGVFANVKGAVLAIVVIVGVLVCAAWLSHMLSFCRLFDAKLSVLRELEGSLPAQPFRIETGKLSEPHPHDPGKRKWKYMPVTILDSILPVAFAVLLLGMLFFRLGQQ